MGSPSSSTASSPRSGRSTGRSFSFCTPAETDGPDLSSQYVKLFAQRLVAVFGAANVDNFVKGRTEAPGQQTQVLIPVSLFLNMTQGERNRNCEQQAFNNLIFRTVNHCLKLLKSNAHPTPWKKRLIATGYTPISSRKLPNFPETFTAAVVEEVEKIFRNAPSERPVEDQGAGAQSGRSFTFKITESERKVADQLLEREEVASARRWIGRDADEQEAVVFALADNILDRMFVELVEDLGGISLRKQR